MPKLHMAAFGKRVHHSKGFYRALDRLSSADFTQTSRRGRKTVDRGRMFKIDYACLYYCCLHKLCLIVFKLT